MKRLISILMLLCLTTSTVFGVTQSQVDTAKNNLKNEQTRLDNVKKEEKDMLAQINNLDETINSTEEQIENAEAEIKRLEDSIVITKQNIEYAQKEYDEKYELRKDRMVAYYKNGSTSLWSLAYDTDDATEFMYRYRLIDKIVDYDTKLIADLKADKEELEKQKQQLEADVTRCAELKTSLEEKRLALNETKEKRVEYLAGLQNSRADLEKSVDKLNAEAKALEAELAKSSSKSSTKYAGGSMTWPLPGYYIITSPFGNRLHPILKVWKLHTGVDIAGANCNGASVVAANSGTVIKATYSTAYGNYIIIDHGGGITTLYAHSSKLLVKVGDHVEKGQEIMKVGTTGYSTGPHLHFEVRENGTYVNPLDASKGYLKN